MLKEGLVNVEEFCLRICSVINKNKLFQGDAYSHKPAKLYECYKKDEADS